MAAFVQRHPGPPPHPGRTDPRWRAATPQVTELTFGPHVVRVTELFERGPRRDDGGHMIRGVGETITFDGEYVPSTVELVRRIVAAADSFSPEAKEPATMSSGDEVLATDRVAGRGVYLMIVDMVAMYELIAGRRPETICIPRGVERLLDIHIEAEFPGAFTYSIRRMPELLGAGLVWDADRVELLPDLEPRP